MSQSGIQTTGARPSSSRLELFLIILMPFGGLALAAWMYFAGEFLPDGRSHQGNMLTPPITLDDFKATNLSAETLEGNWGLLVVTGNNCDTKCRETLFLTRQAHIALNRNASRMSRMFVSKEITGNAAHELIDLVEKEHQGLRMFNGSMPELPYGSDESVRVFLSDPLGNVMLWYGKDHTGKQMIRDMEKLLKASRIG